MKAVFIGDYSAACEELTVSKPPLPSNPGTWPREYTEAWSWLGEQGPPRSVQGVSGSRRGPAGGWDGAEHAGIQVRSETAVRGQEQECQADGCMDRWQVPEAWHRSPASGKMTR